MSSSLHRNNMKYSKTLTNWCVGLVILPCSVVAAEWSVESGAELRSGFDDNIRLATESGESVRSETFAPSMVLSRNTPLSLVAVGARLRFTRYSGDGMRDTNVQYLNFSSQYRQARASWSVKGLFKRDTTLTTIAEPDILADDVVDVDEGLIRVLVRRSRIDVEPFWNRSLTEKMSIRLGYRLRDVSYSNAGDTGLVDYQRKELRAVLAQELSRKDKISVTTLYSQYEAPGAGTETDGNGLVLAMNREFRPTMRGRASIGYRKSSSVSADTQETESSDITWRIGLEKKYSDVTSYRVSLGRGLNSSGAGRVVKSDRLRFRVKKKITPLLAANVKGYALRNKVLEGESGSIDRTIYRVDLGLRKTLSRYWSLNADYRYRWQKNAGKRSSARSNAIFVGVRYKS